MGPKQFIRHYSGATHWIFSNNPSFCSKFCFTQRAASLFQKFVFIGGLGPSDHFSGKWTQNNLSDITLEPHIQFSQTISHFVRNFVLHTKLLVSFRNVALLGAWNLVNTFETIQRISEKLPQPWSLTHISLISKTQNWAIGKADWRSREA